MIDDEKRDRKTFSDWAYLAINKHYNKFLSHESAVLEDKDPEELHQMRVGMRRLRSAIQGFANALNLPENAQDKNVGRIAKALGKLRDIDVLEDTLKNQYYPNLPKDEKKYLKQGLSHLEKQRKEVVKKVRKTLKSQEYCDLKFSFSQWLEKPKFQDIGQVNIETVLADLLLPQVSQLMLHPGWMIGLKFKKESMIFPDSLSEEKLENLLDAQGFILHDLRKAAKRTRYNMDLFTQFYGDKYNSYLKDIKAIQTILGDIQDSFVLGEFIDHVFDDNILKEMPTFSKILQENRYGKWKQWEKLHHKFLNPNTRQDFHLTILKPSSFQAKTEDNNYKTNQEFISVSNQ